MDSTIYLQIPGFTGYRIGNDGSFWSSHIPGSRGKLGKWILIKPYPNGKSGHLFVRLARNGKNHKRYIHRLVLEAFVGSCPIGMEACHNPDPDPSNNRLDNLRWDTRANNIKDTARHGHAYRGNIHFYSKLKEQDIPKIFEMFREFPGIQDEEVGILFGVRGCTIRAVREGRNWGWMNLAN